MTAPTAPAPTIPPDAEDAAFAAELARLSGGTPAPVPEVPSEPPAEAPAPAAAPEATPEGAEAAEPAVEGDEPAPAFDVEMPLPNGDGENGPQNAGRLKLALPSQESADALRFHLKRSAAAAKLEGKLDQYHQDHATVDFLQANPVEGMLWMAQVQPDAGAQYVDHWIRSNPTEAANALIKLGFTVDYGEANERTLKAEAAVAKMEGDRRLQQGQGQFQQTNTVTRFQTTASDVVQELVADLGYTKEDPRFPLVTTALAEHLAALYQQNPQATRAQMLLHAQPVVREEAAYRTKTSSQRSLRVAQATEQPRDPAGQFAAKAALADKMARAQPRGTSIVTPLSVAKAKPGQTWDDVVKDLKAGPTRP